jgi:hypothetical protein
MPNPFEKLAALFPGYAGYSERERSRETDQALRRAVAQLLADRKLVIDRLIAIAARAMRFEALEPLESVKRRLDRLAGMVRHAPAGYAGLFDAQRVETGELDRLIAHDDRIRQSVEELSVTIDALALPGGGEIEQVEQKLSAIEDAIRCREEIVKGVN